MGLWLPAPLSILLLLNYVNTGQLDLQEYCSQFIAFAKRMFADLDIRLDE